MKKIISAFAVIAILAILSSGIFAEFVKFCCWLVLLQYTAPETTIVGGIIVRILTFIVSFGLVGIIFQTIGLFNSKLMSGLYAIISIIIGLVFCYIVWIIETYILIIGIILGVLAVLCVTYCLLTFVASKKIKSNN